MTLEERVRYYVGEGGPQHETLEEYEEYIDDTLNRMSNVELLSFISMVLENDDERRN